MKDLSSPIKTSDEESGKRLAVLIDADNAQPAVIEALLEEVALYGEAIVRRIYGDFTAPASGSWKTFLNKHSIKAVQQFAYTVGKNATDSTMIIDAMDLLYTRRLDGFCLVTSDSDFTGLAVRLREEGLLVYGFGEKKTPEAFRNACHKFIFTEVLRPASKKSHPASSSAPVVAPALKQSSGPAVVPEIPAAFLMEALTKSVDETGWSHLGTFGSYLQKIQPDFDTRIYGFKKLSDLVKGNQHIFKIQERDGPGGDHKVLYVRAKNSV
ncbi:NYN domain-containing protein [Synechococcus sp. GreenBA-s]|nr:NYN domain-containing protein [Synechococcus sp. GreenBA-s]